jgi:fibronectin type 3 domain-containing protein
VRHQSFVDREQSYRPRAGRTRAAAATAIAERLESRALLSTTYYVSASLGADAADGSLDAPFATIQRAADLAQAGDTVLVRAGIYRETVKPANSGSPGAPIVFKPFEGESVTVSGADEVGGWSPYQGAIHRADQPWTLGPGNDQVFVDGRMMVEARWPNTTPDVSRPTRATADDLAANYAGVESVATLRDADLSAFAAGAWDGATVHLASGEQWVWQTGRVTSSGGGALAFNYEQRTGTKSESFETPRPGNPYFLTGKFVALDAAGEWFRDPAGGRLYLWTPQGDSPAAGHTVEAKRRQYAFDLNGRSHVTVQGFNLFAAAITADAASSHVTIDGVDAQYVSHFGTAATGWGDFADSGLSLRGTDSVVRNSTIAFSAGHGIFLAGSRNRAENNVIHDADYAGVNGAGIRARGSGHLIVHNTVHDIGRTGIHVSNMAGGRVVGNLVHDVMLQTTDGGAIYTFGTDGQGTEIAYNRVYRAVTAGFGGAGVYLDNGSNHYVVHHNLSYDVGHALKMNDPSPFNQVYNNTLVGRDNSIDSNRQFEMTGTVFRNNILRGVADIGATAVASNNLMTGTDPRFVNAAAGDYRLQSTSPAINFGTEVSPYTDGFAGAAPDAGAFEFGQAPWVAGADGAYDADAEPPGPAQQFTATGNPAGASLDWADRLEPDRLGYDVYASDAEGGEFAKLNDLPLTRSEFLDTGLAAGATRYYRVVVIDTAGNESSPASASTTRPVDADLPAVPQNVTAAAPSGNLVSISWDSAGGAARYSVERKGPGETAFARVGTVVFLTTYADTTAAPGRAYSYRVIAENSLGGSAASASVAVNTPPVPRVPTGVVAKAVSSTRADVFWSAITDTVPGGTSPVVSQFIVERSRDNATWVRVRTFAAATTGFSDVNLPAGARYFYRARAAGPGGTSAPSAVVQPPVLPPPPAPTGLTATAASPARVDLRWADVAGETGYTIERSTNGGTTWASLATTGAGVTTYADTTAAPDTAYAYRVRATNAGGASPASTVATVRTPAAPTTGTTYEAESATIVGASKAANQPGFSGTGFVDYAHNTGDYVEFTVNAPAAGNYALEFRYANGSTGDRPLELKVNGAVALAKLSFAPTGSWSTWKTTTATATLNAGTNVVRLTATGSNGANLDALTVRPLTTNPPPPPPDSAVYQAESAAGWS